jgi:DNA polymerase kappa
MTPADAVQQLRDEVKAETGLTVSAGVGPNTMLAKARIKFSFWSSKKNKPTYPRVSQIAADVNKPDGQFVIAPTKEACMEFMAEKSVRKIPGVSEQGLFCDPRCAGLKLLVVVRLVE